MFFCFYVFNMKMHFGGWRIENLFWQVWLSEHIKPRFEEFFFAFIVLTHRGYLYGASRKLEHGSPLKETGLDVFWALLFVLHVRCCKNAFSRVSMNWYARSEPWNGPSGETCVHGVWGQLWQDRGHSPGKPGDRAWTPPKCKLFLLVTIKWYAELSIVETLPFFLVAPCC